MSKVQKAYRRKNETLHKGKNSGIARPSDYGLYIEYERIECEEYHATNRSGNYNQVASEVSDAFVDTFQTTGQLQPVRVIWSGNHDENGMPTVKLVGYGGRRMIAFDKLKARMKEALETDGEILPCAVADKDGQLWVQIVFGEAEEEDPDSFRAFAVQTVENGQRLDDDLSNLIPRIWHQVRVNNITQKEIAKHIGKTADDVTQMVHAYELGLTPYVDTVIKISAVKKIKNFCKKNNYDLEKAVEHLINTFFTDDPVTVPQIIEELEDFFSEDAKPTISATKTKTTVAGKGSKKVSPKAAPKKGWTNGELISLMEDEDSLFPAVELLRIIEELEVNAPAEEIVTLLKERVTPVFS